MNGFILLIFKIFFVSLCSFVFSTVSASGPLLGIHVSETDINSFKEKMDSANDVGLKVIRVPVDWNALEPTNDISNEGEYDAAYVDEIKTRVSYAQLLGQKVVMMLSQSPAWASGASGTNSAAYPPLPAYYQDYANAMAYLHGELIDDVTINSETITAWEVWNEPNVLEFWRPDSPVARPGAFVLIPLDAANEYAELLTTTYDEMKGLYPEVTILGGSLASADTDYLDVMYNFFDGNNKFDHLSIHPYSRVDEEGDLASNPNYGKSQFPNQCNASDSLAPPWCYKQGVENIRNTLDSHGDTNKQIWFTEFGTSSAAEWGAAGSEVEQKEHMKRALDILRDWYLDDDAMKISVAIMYRLQDESDHYGIFDSQLNPKPVSDEVEARLDNNGRLITGNQNPSAPLLLSPINNVIVQAGSQNFKWQAAAGATSYLLWVNNYTTSGDFNGAINQSYSPSQASCDLDNECSVNPGETLLEGSAEWWVTAGFENGESIESSPGAFEISNNIQIYEDAEDGTTDGWIIYDKTPAGASISNVHDTAKSSQVIAVQGSGTQNGYRLGNHAGKTGAWNNTSQKVISWDMKFAENFFVRITVDTLLGQRYLVYRPLNTNLGIRGNTGNSIHIGLGTEIKNGQWHKLTRDLEADLQLFEANNQILSVNGFLIKGSGRLDNITLSTSQPDSVFEDAEDGNTSGWVVYDQTPSGALINNENDAARGSRVISVQGSGTQNGYRLGNHAGKAGAWNNTSQKVISWDMKFSENFKLFVTVDTPLGQRYLVYRPVNTDSGIGGTNGNYIHHGLGIGAKSGQWQTFSRDLQADLEEFEAGNQILSVNGVLIRGSGGVDNIRLSKLI